MKTHAKQVAAWGKLLGLVHEMGDSFNPSKESMNRTAMENLLDESQKSIEAVHIAEGAFISAANIRDLYIRKLPDIGSRILGVLESVEAPVDTLHDVNRLRKRLSYQSSPKTEVTAQKKGSGAQAELTSTADASNTPGKRQQLDIASKIDNFELLIQTLRNVGDYTTKEEGLDAEALISFLKEIKDINQEAISASAALKKARANRDAILYSASGVYGRSKMVKGYFRSKFGFNSEQFKNASKIRFTKKG